MEAEELRTALIILNPQQHVLRVDREWRALADPGDGPLFDTQPRALAQRLGDLRNNFDLRVGVVTLHTPNNSAFASASPVPCLRSLVRNVPERRVVFATDCAVVGTEAARLLISPAIIGAGDLVVTRLMDSYGSGDTFLASDAPATPTDDLCMAQVCNLLKDKADLVYICGFDGSGRDFVTCARQLQKHSKNALSVHVLSDFSLIAADALGKEAETGINVDGLASMHYVKNTLEYIGVPLLTLPRELQRKRYYYGAPSSGGTAGGPLRANHTVGEPDANSCTKIDRLDLFPTSSASADAFVSAALRWRGANALSPASLRGASHIATSSVDAEGAADASLDCALDAAIQSALHTGQPVLLMLTKIMGSGLFMAEMCCRRFAGICTDARAEVDHKEDCNSATTAAPLVGDRPDGVESLRGLLACEKTLHHWIDELCASDADGLTSLHLFAAAGDHACLALSLQFIQVLIQAASCLRAESAHESAADRLSGAANVFFSRPGSAALQTLCCGMARGDRWGNTPISLACAASRARFSSAFSGEAGMRCRELALRERGSVPVTALGRSGGVETARVRIATAQAGSTSNSLPLFRPMYYELPLVPLAGVPPQLVCGTAGGYTLARHPHQPEVTLAAYARVLELIAWPFLAVGKPFHMVRAMLGEQLPQRIGPSRAIETQSASDLAYARPISRMLHNQHSAAPAAPNVELPSASAAAAVAAAAGNGGGGGSRGHQWIPLVHAARSGFLPVALNVMSCLLHEVLTAIAKAGFAPVTTDESASLLARLPAAAATPTPPSGQPQMASSCSLASPVAGATPSSTAVSSGVLFVSPPAFTSPAGQMLISRPTHNDTHSDSSQSSAETGAGAVTFFPALASRIRSLVQRRDSVVSHTAAEDRSQLWLDDVLQGNASLLAPATESVLNAAEAQSAPDGFASSALGKGAAVAAMLERVRTELQIKLKRAMSREYRGGATILQLAAWCGQLATVALLVRKPLAECGDDNSGGSKRPFEVHKWAQPDESLNFEAGPRLFSCGAVAAAATAVPIASASAIHSDLHSLWRMRWDWLPPRIADRKIELEVAPSLSTQDVAASDFSLSVNTTTQLSLLDIVVLCGHTLTARFLLLEADALPLYCAGNRVQQVLHRLILLGDAQAADKMLQWPRAAGIIVDPPLLTFSSGFAHADRCTFVGTQWSSPLPQFLGVCSVCARRVCLACIDYCHDYVPLRALGSAVSSTSSAERRPKCLRHRISSVVWDARGFCQCHGVHLPSKSTQLDRAKQVRTAALVTPASSARGISRASSDQSGPVTSLSVERDAAAMAEEALVWVPQPEFLLASEAIVHAWPSELQASATDTVTLCASAFVDNVRNRREIGRRSKPHMWPAEPPAKDVSTASQASPCTFKISALNAVNSGPGPVEDASALQRSNLSSPVVLRVAPHRPNRISSLGIESVASVVSESSNTAPSLLGLPCNIDREPRTIEASVHRSNSSSLPSTASNGIAAGITNARHSLTRSQGTSLRVVLESETIPALTAADAPADHAVDDCCVATATAAEADIDRFAKSFHIEWCRMVSRQGWQWGEKFNARRFLNPNLCSWCRLPRAVQEENKLFARGILSVLYKPAIQKSFCFRIHEASSPTSCAAQRLSEVQLHLRQQLLHRLCKWHHDAYCMKRVLKGDRWAGEHNQEHNTNLLLMPFDNLEASRQRFYRDSCEAVLRTLEEGGRCDHECLSAAEASRMRSVCVADGGTRLRPRLVWLASLAGAAAASDTISCGPHVLPPILMKSTSTLASEESTGSGIAVALTLFAPGSSQTLRVESTQLAITARSRSTSVNHRSASQVRATVQLPPKIPSVLEDYRKRLRSCFQRAAVMAQDEAAGLAMLVQLQRSEEDAAADAAFSENDGRGGRKKKGVAGGGGVAEAALKQSAYLDRADMVRYFAIVSPALLRTRDSYGLSAQHYAALGGHTHILQLLEKCSAADSIDAQLPIESASPRLGTSGTSAERWSRLHAAFQSKTLDDDALLSEGLNLRRVMEEYALFAAADDAPLVHSIVVREAARPAPALAVPAAPARPYRKSIVSAVLQAAFIPAASRPPVQSLGVAVTPPTPPRNAAAPPQLPTVTEGSSTGSAQSGTEPFGFVRTATPAVNRVPQQPFQHARDATVDTLSTAVWARQADCVAHLVGMHTHSTTFPDATGLAPYSRALLTHGLAVQIVAYLEKRLARYQQQTSAAAAAAAAAASMSALRSLRFAPRSASWWGTLPRLLYAVAVNYSGAAAAAALAAGSAAGSISEAHAADAAFRFGRRGSRSLAAARNCGYELVTMLKQLEADFRSDIQDRSTASSAVPQVDADGSRQSATFPQDVGAIETPVPDAAVASAAGLYESWRWVPGTDNLEHCDSVPVARVQATRDHGTSGTTFQAASPRQPIRPRPGRCCGCSVDNALGGTRTSVDRGVTGGEADSFIIARMEALALAKEEERATYRVVSAMHASSRVQRFRFLWSLASVLMPVLYMVLFGLWVAVSPVGPNLLASDDLGFAQQLQTSFQPFTVSVTSVPSWFSFLDKHVLFVPDYNTTTEGPLTGSYVASESIGGATAGRQLFDEETATLTEVSAPIIITSRLRRGSRQLHDALLLSGLSGASAATVPLRQTQAAFTADSAATAASESVGAPVLLQPAGVQWIVANDAATSPTLFDLTNSSSGIVTAGSAFVSTPLSSGGSVPASASGAVDGLMSVGRSVVIGAVRLRAVPLADKPCAAWGSLPGYLGSGASPPATACLDSSLVSSPPVNYGHRESLNVLPQADLSSSVNTGYWVDLDAGSVMSRRAAVDAITPASTNPLPPPPRDAHGALVQPPPAAQFVNAGTRSLVIDLTLYDPGAASLACVRLYAAFPAGGPATTFVVVRALRSPYAAYAPPWLFLFLTSIQALLHLALCFTNAHVELLRHCYGDASRRLPCCNRQAVASIAAGFDTTGATPGARILEVVYAVLLLSVVGWYSVLLSRLDALGLTASASSTFYDAWSVMDAWQAVRDLIAVLVFISTMRFIRILGVLPFVGPVLTALRKTIGNHNVLINVAITLCIMLVVAISHTIAFGGEALPFGIIRQSFIALFTVAFGSDVSSFGSVNPRATSSLFFIVWCVVAGLLFNLLIAVVANTFEEMVRYANEDWQDGLTHLMEDALLQDVLLDGERDDEEEEGAAARGGWRGHLRRFMSSVRSGSSSGRGGHGGRRTRSAMSPLERRQRAELKDLADRIKPSDSEPVAVRSEKLLEYLRAHMDRHVRLLSSSGSGAETARGRLEDQWVELRNKLTAWRATGVVSGALSKPKEGRPSQVPSSAAEAASAAIAGRRGSHAERL